MFGQTLDGEVLDGLDGNDAASFDRVLYQSEAEMFGLRADEAELLEQDTETEVLETERARNLRGLSMVSGWEFC